jgi:hypothetical protein
MTQSERKPYDGPAKKLIVSVDVGTTFTAVSFSILQPGDVPQFNEASSRVLLREYCTLTDRLVDRFNIGRNKLVVLPSLSLRSYRTID